MSLERRVREALHDAAEAPGPTAIEAGLERVRRQGRSSRPGIVGVVGAAIVIVIAALAIGPIVPGLGPSIPTASDPPPSPKPVPPLIGTYRTTLGADAAGVESAGMAGSWTLVIAADGSLVAEAPATFQLPGGGRPTHAIHAEEGDEFTTTLFARDLTAACATPGRYEWRRTEVLTFSVVADTCEERRTLLVSSPWTPVPSPGA